MGTQRLSSTLAVIALCCSATLSAQTPEYSKDKVYNALQPLLPAGVGITTVSMAGNRATISGTSSSNAQLSQFLRNADGAPEFEMPELESVATDGTRVQYTIAVDVRCAEGPARSGSALCAGAASRGQAVYKCRIDGTLTFQATPCPDAPAQ